MKRLLPLIGSEMVLKETRQQNPDPSASESFALDDMEAAIYAELRRVARRLKRTERRDHTLQTTALVHEAYLKLAQGAQVKWHRKDFFGVAAHVMREVLVDYARGVNRAKRGGGAVKVPIADFEAGSPPQVDEVLALEEALRRLEAMDTRKLKVVELRVFAGLDNQDIAEVLGVSANTVIRDWNFAKAWLARELTR